jgi:hypothetical protein
MDFVRWYSGPVMAGFVVSLMINPFIAGVGLVVWLALIYYIFRRWEDTVKH